MSDLGPFARLPVTGSAAGSGVSTQPAAEPDLGPFAALPIEQPGFFRVVKESAKRGLAEGVQEVGDTATGPFIDRKRPPHVPDAIDKAAEGLDLLSPTWYGANIGRALGQTAPSFATGAAGAVAGGLVAGPPGAIVGGALGFGGGAAGQSLSSAYQRAIAEGLDHEAAKSRAYAEAGVHGAAGAAAALAPGVAMFGRLATGAMRRPGAELAAQTFAAQPAIGAYDQLATGAVQGRMPTGEEMVRGAVVDAGIGAVLATPHYLARGGRAPPEPPPAVPPEAPLLALPSPVIPMGGPDSPRGPTIDHEPLALPPPRPLDAADRGAILRTTSDAGVDALGPRTARADQFTMVRQSDPLALISRYENRSGDPLRGWGETDLSGYPLSETGFPAWPGKPGPKGNSTAAGLYQITRSTWDPIARRLGITDFSPESQRAVATELYRTRGFEPWAPNNPALARAIARGEAGEMPAGAAGAELLGLPAPQRLLPRPDTTYGDDFLMRDSDTRPPAVADAAVSPPQGTPFDRVLNVVSRLEAGAPVTRPLLARLSGLKSQEQIVRLRNRLVSQGLVRDEGNRYTRAATVNAPERFAPPPAEVTRIESPQRTATAPQQPAPATPQPPQAAALPEIGQPLPPGVVRRPAPAAEPPAPTDPLRALTDKEAAYLTSVRWASPEELARPIEGGPITPQSPRTSSVGREIGKNHLGQTLYEDQRGVRSIVENGVRTTEPVQMQPTRGGMRISTDRTDRPEYLTSTEAQALPSGAEAPTVPAPAENANVRQPASDELRGTLPPRDAGTSAEDVHGTAPVGPPRPAPPGEEPRGAGDVQRPPPSEPGPGVAGTPRGGGDRAGDADRVPAGDRRPRPDDGVTGTNHVIEPGSLAEERTPRAKLRDNISAIELAKSLIAEGRPATKEEQSILARYVGWGGLANVFPDPNTGKLRKGFEDVGARVKALLTPDEYRTAARSTQYAHYTSEPVIRAMWGAVERMGFKGGTVFEPGMGVGHFLGLMPPELAASSKYQGIEMDHLTAGIAKLLYPESGVRQGDFTRTKLPLDTFDLAIGNPPFADTTITSDPKYAARKFLLHDYFFAKSLDSVRPGGLMAFITSAGTMNKLDEGARKFLADRAEFVGGVTLPSTAFSRNAGTEVTTSILFFKKRAAPIDVGSDLPDWAQTVVRRLPNRNGDEVNGNVNRYFSEHPEMVLGDEGFFDKLYKDRYAVHETPGTVLADRLNEALGRLPENVMEPPLTPGQKAALDFSGVEKKEGSFYIADDGRLMQYSDGAGRPVERRGAGVEGGKTAAEIETIRRLLPLRDALREVFRHDLADNAEEGAAARARLNRVYDSFVRQNGPINKEEVSYRRPNIIQQEAARAAAREEAREMGHPWEAGTFDPEDMIARGARAGEIARAHNEARERARTEGREFDEGTFDPSDMPDIEIVKRPNIDPFQDDQESYRLRALENYDKPTGAAEKRRVFRENTLTREQDPQLNSPEDGILWSMNKHGRLDIDAIAEKLGTDKRAVVEGLGDHVMRAPGTEEVYLPRDAYLSGDVVTKLAEAKAAAERDPSFQKNVAALEAAQPEPLSPAEIAMTIGMPWLPPETMHAFVDSVGIGRASISHSPTLGQWSVSGVARGARDAEWGTPDLSAHEILAAAMNRKMPVIRRHDRGPPATSWVDKVATEGAAEKVQQLRDAFETWAQSDPERAHKLAEIYNAKFNRVVLREWNGDYLTTPGVSSEWQWRPHQTRVVARIIQDGNTYMAHAVGAGKTSAMIGSGMEMRRLGLVNKPMYVVPNHMLGQFATEFYQQYPSARIAVADDRNFHTSRRKQFVANVAQQDLDAVIITNSAFKKVPISDEFGEKMIREQVDEIDQVLIELGQNPNDLTRISRGVDEDKKYTVKQLQKKKERLEQKLRSGSGDKDAVNTFEEMGVDFLFVDEAHQFRKLSFTTQNPMKGVTPEGSEMAWDLYTKVRYLDENRPGRSLVMASGTPITNTMGELYTLSRFIQPQALKERGLAHFDSWSGAFGQTRTDTEQTATGAYEPVTRFSEFVNMPELYKMVGSQMDVVTSEQLARYVTRPTLDGGGRNLHLAERTPWLDRFQAELAQRVEAIKQRKGPPKPGDDILLSIITDGRKGAIDPRLIDMDRPSDPSSKLNEMVDNVHRIWAESRDQPFYDPATGYRDEVMHGPATQMVFANFGINNRNSKGEPSFSTYDWMRREWQRRGIPAHEIGFIGEAKGAVAKQRLINDVNEGKVRILVGSTQKMGTGINAQRRLKAIHNLDPLWYPADDEQRNGRGLRQGNLNPTLQIHDYTTKGTYDSTMWGMMGRKGRFIEQFFRGDPTLRRMEDLGEASQYEQASAMSTTDPRVIVLTEMKQELAKLERREQAHASQEYSLRFRAERAAEDAADSAKGAAQITDAIGRAQDISGDKFQMTVGRRTFGVRKEAAEAITAAIEKTYPGMQIGESRPLGEIGGFPLSIEALQTRARRPDDTWETIKDPVPSFRLRLAEGHDIKLGSTTGPGIINSASTYIHGLPERLAMYQAQQRDAEARALSNRSALGKPFAEGDKIEPLRQQVREMEAEIHAPPAAAETPSDGTVREQRPGASSDTAPTGPVDRAASTKRPITLWRSDDSVSRDRIAIRDELYRLLKERAPTLRLRTFDDLAEIIEGRPSPIHGIYHTKERPGGLIEHIAEISLSGPDPRATLSHEIVHFLRGAGLFTKQEWAILAGKSDKWAKQFEIDERYPEVSSGIRREEAVAEAYAAWHRGDMQLPPGLRRIFGKVQQFFERIGNFLRGQGYQTADDVFGRMSSGEVGGRSAQSAQSAFEPLHARPRTPADERVRAALGQIRVTPDDRPLWQRSVDMMKGTWTRLREEGRYAGIDDFDPIQTMEKAGNSGSRLDASVSAFTMAHLTRELPTIMARAAGIPLGDGRFAGGVPMMRDGAVVLNPASEPLLAFLNPLKEANRLDAWQLWAAVNRGRGLMAEGRENLITPEIIAAHRNDHLRPENLGPNGENLFLDAMRGWNKFKGQTLDFGQQTGIVNREARALFDRGDYVPFLRAIGVEENVLGPGRGGRGIANQNSPIKRLTGGTEKLNDIFENMYRVTEAMIARGMKNEAARRTRDLAEPLGVMERASLAEQMAAKGRRDNNIVSVMDEGKHSYYRVTQPLLYKAITAFGPVESGVVLNTLGFPKRFLTEMVTHEPAYMAANLMRDTLHTWVVTGADYKPGWDTAKGALSALRNSPEAMAIMAGGGWYGRSGAAGFMRELGGNDWTPLNSPRKVWEALDRVGSASEQANRIAVYEAARKEGKSEAEAQWLAKDVLNYTASGGSEIMKALVATVPFMNARVQGLDRLQRGARENTRSFMIRGGLIAGAGLALWAINKDNPDYQRLPDYEKQAYWHLFLPGFTLRIPKPFEVGAIFGSVPEMLGDYIDDPNHHRLWSAFTGMLAQQLNMNPIPQAVKPALDVYSNTRWTGGPIVNEAEQNLVPGERFGPNTSATMTALGQQLGLAPDQLEYLFKGYSGTLGSYLLAGADQLTNAASGKVRPDSRIEDIPLVGRFVRTQPALANRWVNGFYDVKTEVDELHSTMGAMAKAGRAVDAQELVRDNLEKLGLRPATTAVGNQLTQIRQAMKTVSDAPNLSSAEKRERLDQLIATRNAIADRSARTIVERARP